MRRKRYQRGTVVLQNGVWRFRYYDENGSKRSIEIGSTELYKNKSQADKAAEQYRVRVNPDVVATRGMTFGSLCTRFVAEELSDRHSTRKGDRSRIKHHIIPKWGKYRIEDVRVFAVEQWLRGLELAPKTKGHIKTCMMSLFNAAMRWELLDPMGQNPMRLVRIPGVSKRVKQPIQYTVQQVWAILENLGEPFRTMLLVDVCLGLRASELVGLQWADIDFNAGLIRVRRGVVEGREGEVKTVHSKKDLPLAPELAVPIQEWRTRSPWAASSDWVFASPFHLGKTPYWPKSVMDYHIKPAAKLAQCEIPKGYGWHVFRHTYSTLLRELKVDVKVQQALLRHADIRTTMNLYTEAVPDTVREANGLVVTKITGRVQ